MSFTDYKVKNSKSLEKEYKLTDGFGMFLLVTPKGPKYGKWLTASERSKESSLAVFTLLFHLLRLDNAVMKLKDLLLRVLILTPGNRPKLKSLKQSVIPPEHSKQ